MIKNSKIIHNFLKPSRSGLIAEFAFIFIITPLVFYFYGTRWSIHLALWFVSIYALVLVRNIDRCSWCELWRGAGWSMAARKLAALRFGLAAPLIVLFTYVVVPDRLFSFPLQRPWFWLLVMMLYPVLSVLPQELLFRSFFFRRYRPLFPEHWQMLFSSAFGFAFAHIVFHNIVSPSFCLIGGLIFASSYSQHRSLKWAVVEHAAYGCFVFTAGIGFYFLVGGYRPG